MSVSVVITATTTGNILARMRARLDSGRILGAAAPELLEGVDEAFVREGPGWAPLAESTARDRQRRGYGPRHPVLQRTGKLRRSWRARIDGDRLIIVSSDPKAAILSRPGRNRPARPVRISRAAIQRAVAAARRTLHDGS